MSDLAALADLLGLHEAQRLGLELALADPAAYCVEYAEPLASRNINAPIPGLLDVALSHALEQRDKVIILDWKYEPDDLEHGLRLCIGELAGELPVDEFEDVDAIEGLEILDEFLSERGYTLFQLGIDGDCYEVFPVANAAAPRVESLLGKLGFDAGPFASA